MPFCAGAENDVPFSKLLHEWRHLFEDENDRIYRDRLGTNRRKLDKNDCVASQDGNGLVDWQEFIGAFEIICCFFPSFIRLQMTP